MRALVLNKALKWEVTTVPKPEVVQGTALVKIHAAAFNRRDFWMTLGLYPGIKTPSILGSDGSGEVVKVGSNKDKHWLGERVIINPSFNWGNDERVQSKRFKILGMPVDGTFAEYIRVPVKQLHRMPKHLSHTTAAALPLAGVTAYRALFVQGGCQINDRVLVTGIGGGVAQYVAQFASAAGANVYVTSGSQEKIERSKKLFGVKDGANYNEKKWRRKLVQLAGGPFDLIIDGAGGKGFNKLLNIAKLGGTIVSYGATALNPNKLVLPRLFLKQLRIIGSTMGSDRDFENMVKFVVSHKIHPHLDCVIPISRTGAAHERLKNCEHFGKIVIDFSLKASL